MTHEDWLKYTETKRNPYTLICTQCGRTTPGHPDSTPHPCTAEHVVSKKEVTQRYLGFFNDGRDSIVRTERRSYLKPCKGTMKLHFTL